MQNASASQDSVLADLVSLWQQRRAEGRASAPEKLCEDCPDLLPELQRRIAVLERMAELADAAHETAVPASVEVSQAVAPSGDVSQETITLDFLKPPIPPLNTRWPNIPGYEILGELGQGGMGIVYKAQQVRLNRTVALKMIRSGSCAGEIELARFHIEAQAIARLQHPHIVQIYEIGEHGGLPYFSLEFCSGGSLDKKLGGTPQPPAEAACLVETLARAMQTAHDRGVVHRDLKPANVLLAEDGTPKVTDFGLAKQMDSKGQTRSNALMGTPSYMAPEQAVGKTREAGPAADVYALGAILYELLTGRPPFKGATDWDTLQMVVGNEPVAPSQLQPKLPRDLETICLKCLHKDAARRFRSALELAEDLHRFRNGEPIHARPIRVPERLMRWARRSPRVAALSAAVVLLVLLLLTGSFLATARIAQSRDDERRLREKADELATKERLTAESAKNAAALLANLFESSDPIGVLSGTPSTRRSPAERRALREMLDSAHHEIGQKFSHEPALRALLLDAIGNAYRSLGFYDRAEPLLREALALRRHRAEEAPLDLAESLHHLAEWHREKGDYELAGKLYQEALDLRVQTLQTEEHTLVADSKLALAWLLTEAGESEKPERLLREVIETRRRLLAPGRREVAIAQIGLAAFLIDRQRNAEAFPLVLQAARVLLTLGELGKMGEAVARFQFGIGLREANSLALAESALRRSPELTQEALGQKHIYVALVLHELGDTLEKRNNLAEATKVYRECLDIARTQVGLTHPKAVYPISSLARVLAKQGRRSEAERLFAELRQANEQRYGKQNVRVATALTAYAAFLDDPQNRARSVQVRQEADDLFRKAGATGHRIFAFNLSGWANSCWALKQYKQAERLAQEALPLIEKHQGRESHTVVVLLDTLSLALISQKRYSEAEPFCQRALKLIPRHPAERWTVLDTAGRLHSGKGQLVEAQRYFQEALAVSRKEHANSPQDLAYSLKALAEVLVRRGEHQQAAPLFAEAERLRKPPK